MSNELWYLRKLWFILRNVLGGIARAFYRGFWHILKTYRQWLQTSADSDQILEKITIIKIACLNTKHTLIGYETFKHWKPWILTSAEWRESYWFRHEFSNYTLVIEIGVDTVENEPTQHIFQLGVILILRYARSTTLKVQELWFRCNTGPTSMQSTLSWAT